MIDCAMAESIICNRAFQFAVRVVKLCERIKADYIAKMCVSSKEARETGYWLRLAIAVSCVKRSDVDWELNEANELRFMIRAAIHTARSSPNRGRDT
jgi:hypothetical protein